MSELTPAQWAVQPFNRYAQFSGRAPRAEYWWFYLATLIINRVLSFVDKKTSGEEGLLSGIFWLIILVPWLAVTIRRLHDTNRSGWWLVTPVVPFAAFLAVMIQTGIAGVDVETHYPVAFYGSLILLVLAAIVLFVFMVLPGNSGPNRYGEDPYRPHDQLEEIFA